LRVQGEFRERDRNDYDDGFCRKLLGALFWMVLEGCDEPDTDARGALIVNVRYEVDRCGI